MENNQQLSLFTGGSGLKSTLRREGYFLAGGVKNMAHGVMNLHGYLVYRTGGGLFLASITACCLPKFRCSPGCNFFLTLNSFL